MGEMISRGEVEFGEATRKEQEQITPTLCHSSYYDDVLHDMVRSIFSQGTTLKFNH